MRSTARVRERRQFFFAQHVAGDLDHGERTAQLMTRIAREIALAFDEFLDARGESVQGARERFHVAVEIRREFLRIERGKIGMFRIPVAHGFGQRDDRRQRAT